MSTLVALQQDFLRTLTGAPLLIHALDAARGLAPKRGLAIYVNAYSARLREALHNDHASLAMLMGEQAWHALVAGYIAAHPSRGPSLRQFGDGLPDFLRRDARYAATPLLAELADFERALLDSFDAADAPVADWADLLALPPARWPRLRPGFVPSLARRVTRTAAVETWKALRRHQTPPATTPVARTDWAIWRDAAQVTRFRSLPEAEAALLDHFIAGGDFAGGCERLLDWHPEPDVPAFAMDALRRWCDEGWVSAWRT